MIIGEKLFVNFFNNMKGQYKTQNILILLLYFIAFLLCYLSYGIVMVIVILVLDLAKSFHLVQILRPQPGGSTIIDRLDNPNENDELPF